MGAAVLIVLVGGVILAGSGGTAEATSQVRTVTVSSVGNLMGGGSSVSVIGTVRSVAEAKILAQAGGTVHAVHTSIGKTVPAGFVIAELSSASESAAVLQAQGAYEGAVAARNITALQSGNASTAYAEAQVAARETYRSSYVTIDTTITNYVDTFFGAATPQGPQLLVNEGPVSNMSQRRSQITTMMERWESKLTTVDTTDPTTLLVEATQNVQTLSTFMNDLSRTASDHDSGATAAQMTALATARANVSAQIASLSAARDALNAKKTASQVGSVQSNGSSAETASADASVKQALGSLRAAQAAYERTVIRAPIGGTVNFLSLHVGDYITSFTHVATVAQNGSLEIVSYVSEDARQALTVGMKVTVEDQYAGVITSIAPALDPVTKQIEVHVAVTGDASLIDGQSVRIGFPNTAVVQETQPAVTGPLLLPLAALKLSANQRIVFTVGEDQRLIAHPVQIGDVRGDRIEVLSGIPSDLIIVTDARGLAEGQKVQIATEAPTTP